MKNLIRLGMAFVAGVVAAHIPFLIWILFSIGFTLYALSCHFDVICPGSLALIKWVTGDKDFFTLYAEEVKSYQDYVRECNR